MHQNTTFRVFLSILFDFINKIVHTVIDTNLEVIVRTMIIFPLMFLNMSDRPLI